jgi:hypothetical protein
MGADEGREAFLGRTDHRRTEGAGAGAKTKDLCRRHAVSDVTFSNWKAKYGGSTVSEGQASES